MHAFMCVCVYARMRVCSGELPTHTHTQDDGVQEKVKALEAQLGVKDHSFKALEGQYSAKEHELRMAVSSIFLSESRNQNCYTNTVILLIRPNRVVIVVARS